MPTTEILWQLFLVFLGAKLAGELALRLRLPAVVGELVVGIALGPHALALVGVPGPDLLGYAGSAKHAGELLHGVFDILGQLGVIILLFVVGLEMRVEDIAAVGPRALVVAVGGLSVSFVLVFAFGQAFGLGSLTSVFLATALVATSAGIAARVLGDLGQLQTNAARLILGAAVIDDILGLVAVGVVGGIASGRGISALAIVTLAAETSAFVLFVALVGRRIIRAYSVHLDRLRLPNATFAAALALCLGLAALAGMVGLAAIVGAFLAGMVVAETREHVDLDRQIRPLYDLLVPIFFVISGTRTDLTMLGNPSLLMLVGGVTALAMLGKLIGCGLGAIGVTVRDRLVVGVGMMPRGEVALIVAGIGQSVGAISESLFAVIVVASIATTIVAPPALKWLLTSGSFGAKLTDETHRRDPRNDDLTLVD